MTARTGSPAVLPNCIEPLPIVEVREAAGPSQKEQPKRIARDRHHCQTTQIGKEKRSACDFQQGQRNLAPGKWCLLPCARGEKGIRSEKWFGFWAWGRKTTRIGPRRKRPAIGALLLAAAAAQSTVSSTHKKEKRPENFQSKKHKKWTSGFSMFFFRFSVFSLRVGFLSFEPMSWCC